MCVDAYRLERRARTELWNLNGTQTTSVCSYNLIWLGGDVDVSYFESHLIIPLGVKLNSPILQRLFPLFNTTTSSSSLPAHESLNIGPETSSSSSLVTRITSKKDNNCCLPIKHFQNISYISSVGIQKVCYTSTNIDEGRIVCAPAEIFIHLPPPQRDKPCL